MMAEIDPHHMETCPYNKSHQVEHYRMQFHLEKCRRSYPNTTNKTCPLDATHVVPEKELDFHINICPKRHLFDAQVYIVDDDCRPPVSVQPVPDDLPSAENWDDDVVVSSYVPDTSQKAHIITKVKGAKPAERRKVRAEGQRSYRPLPSDD